MSTMNKRLCFVLMPFRDDLKEVYSIAIKPACLKAGFESLRVDELKGAFNINRKIVEYTFISDAIIADLTGWNPNVFYELGVAHAIDNKTVMIVQKSEQLPFDISSYRCLQYDQTKAGLEQLTTNLAQVLASIEEWRQYPSNPVQDFKPYNFLITKDRSLDQVKKKLLEKDRLLAKSSHVKAQKLRIFISHANEDKALARQLEDELTIAGADVWVDHTGILGGDNLAKRISDALQWCNTLLLLWSKHANSSHWVEREWGCALNLNKVIIPCLIDKTLCPAIFANTAHVQFSDYDTGKQELLRSLKPVLRGDGREIERNYGRVIFSRLPDADEPPIPKPPQD